MKGIFFALLFVSAQVNASLISYEMTGTATGLNVGGSDEPISLSFVVDTIAQTWCDLNASFLGKAWYAESGFIPTSHEPDHIIMVHWVWFSPQISDGTNQLRFGVPEWKVPSDDPGYDALANLDKGTDWVVVGEHENGDTYGFDLFVTKKTVLSVPEPSSTVLLIVGLFACLFKRVVSDSLISDGQFKRS